MILAALAAVSCKRTPPAARFIWDLPPSKWDSAFAALSAQEQIIAFKHGVTDIHPKIELRTQLASQGREMITPILSELKESHDPRYIAALIAVMAEMRCRYGIRFDDRADSLLTEAVDRASGAPQGEMAGYHARSALEGDCDTLPPRPRSDLTLLRALSQIERDDAMAQPPNMHAPG